jgi:hypothetical protein
MTIAGFDLWIVVAICVASSGRPISKNITFGSDAKVVNRPKKASRDRQQGVPLRHA